MVTSVRLYPFNARNKKFILVLFGPTQKIHIGAFWPTYISNGQAQKYLMKKMIQFFHVNIIHILCTKDICVVENEYGASCCCVLEAYNNFVSIFTPSLSLPHFSLFLFIKKSEKSKKIKN